MQKQSRPRKIWTKERLIEAMLLWKEEFGRQPMATDWLTHLVKGYPSVTPVQAEFGSWTNGCRAAGLHVNEPLKKSTLPLEPRSLEHCLKLLVKYQRDGVAPAPIKPLQEQFANHGLTWLQACEQVGLRPWTPRNSTKKKEKRPKHSFDWDEAIRLYDLGRGASFDALATRYGVAPQTIRTVVIPGERERKLKKDRWRRDQRRKEKERARTKV
jgi:Homing endonuclease associated repeat